LDSLIASPLSIEVKSKNPPIHYFLLGLTTLGIAVLLAVFNGISVGYSNHSGLLPVVRRIVDLTYLPGDFNITMRLYHHRGFAHLVAAFTSVFGEDRALIVLSVLSLVLLAGAILYLCRVLKLTLTWGALAGAFIALRVIWSGFGIEVNDFIGNPEVQPPIFAHALILIGLAALIEGKYRLPAFLAGIVLTIHLQIGLIFALLLAPFYLVKRKPFGPKEIVRLAFIALVPALPAFWHVAEMLQRGVNDSAFTLDYILFRIPHHFEPASAANVVWVALHLVIQIICFIWMKRMRPDESPGLRTLMIVSLASTLLAILHLADFYYFRTLTFLKPQFLRFTPLITVFGSLSLITALRAWADENKVLIGRLTFSHCVQAFLVVLIIDQGIARVQANPPLYTFSVQKYSDEESAWVQLCRWINQNGPKATYLTPPGHDGFTYLTNRSTVVEFKINPDGALYLKEWYERLNDLSGGVLPHERGFANILPLDQAYAALTSSQLMVLRQKYQADYAVLPQSSRAQFPVLFQNADYRLVRLAE